MTGSIVLGQKLKSVAEIEVAVAKYSKEQHVPYTRRNSTTATTYNMKNPHRLMPLSKEFKDIVYTCKHYGSPRQSKHKPGTKQRGNQSTFKKYCKAKINICFNISEDCFEISKLEETHTNHKPEKKHAKHYPEFRQVKAEVVANVQVLFENEAKTHRIRDVVINSGVLATRQDIQNLRNKWLDTIGKTGSAEDQVIQQLMKLKEDDPNAVVVLHYDQQSKVIQSIFFQTSFMREGLELYPELIVMDTTYKLCDNEMPLVVFSVVDCFGAGRIAGYALIFSENKVVVTAALQVLKLSSKQLEDQLKIIYVDKSQAEVASIKTVFPSTEIHLCDFHVKDVFSKQAVKKLAKDNWDEVDKYVKELIHAHSKEIYDKVYQELKIAAGGETSEFMKYFDKYWHTANIHLIWSDYQRNESFTLGERTTGRVESHNAKIKIMIQKKLPVAEVILRLCILNRNSSIDNAHRVFNETVKNKYHKYSTDPVLQSILRVNTPFVGSFLKAQYERSLEPPSMSVHKTDTETCDCKYFYQSRLICSHIFRERRKLGVEIYDHKLVPPRWTVIIPTEEQTNFEQFEIITSPVKTSKKKKTMSIEERYTLAEGIALRISSHIANFGGNEFFSRIVQLQNFEDLMRIGKRVAVVGVNGEGEPDLQSIVNNQSEDNQETVNPTQTSETSHENRTEECDHAESLSKQLKLPQKCTVPGRPKGKRSQQKKKSPAIIAEEVMEVDEPPAGRASKCNFCEGPVVMLTSCSKSNQGKKYIMCETNVTDKCLTFHKWVDIDEIESRESDPNPSQIIDSFDDLSQQSREDDEILIQHTNSSSSSIDEIDSTVISAPQPQPSRPVKICFSCQKPAIILVSRSNANYGRHYYTCVDRFINLRCKWINWIKDKKILPTVLPAKQNKVISPVKQTKITSFMVEAQNNNLAHTSTSLSLNDDYDDILSNAASVFDSTHVSLMDMGDDGDVKPNIRFNKPVTDSSEKTVIVISDDDTGDEDELQSCISQSFDERLSCICIICQKNLESLTATCVSCRTVVHMECTVMSPSNDETRLCTNCFCLLCKGVGGENHICECSVCNFPVTNPGGILCYRCERLCHDMDCSEKIIAEEKDNAERYLCQLCSHTLRRGVPLSAWHDLLNNQELTDHHIARACFLLRKLFGGEIDGLQDPLAVTFGREVENIHHYSPKTSNKDYVQIMYTGSSHWVTAIFKKGCTSVIILNSLQSEVLSGHIDIQIGMISQTAGAITVIRPPVQKQSNYSDCGLYAIAYATEYCFNKTTQLIDYDETKLREHWRNCLTSAEISPFPRLSKRAKKTKREDAISTIRIHCSVCLLPDNYSDMISCDECEEWFHKICVRVGPTFIDSDEWLCNSCTL